MTYTIPYKNCYKRPLSALKHTLQHVNKLCHILWNSSFETEAIICVYMHIVHNSIIIIISFWKALAVHMGYPCILITSMSLHVKDHSNYDQWILRWLPCSQTPQVQWEWKCEKCMLLYYLAANVNTVLLQALIVWRSNSVCHVPIWFAIKKKKGQANNSSCTYHYSYAALRYETFLCSIFVILHTDMTIMVKVMGSRCGSRTLLCTFWSNQLRKQITAVCRPVAK